MTTARRPSTAWKTVTHNAGRRPMNLANRTALSLGVLTAVAMLAFVLVLVGDGSADPIVVIDTFHFRDVRGPNQTGLVEGDRLLFGTDVTPNPSTGDSGTTVTAVQAATSLSLRYLESPALPNQYVVSVPYDPSLTGSWRLTIQNPNSANSPVIVDTPSVGSTPAVEFVRNMSLTAGPTETRPVFNWTLPPSGTFESASIFIFDLD